MGGNMEEKMTQSSRSYCGGKAPFVAGLLGLALFAWLFLVAVDKLGIGLSTVFSKRSITVSGTSTSQQKNQVARYSAAVSSKNTDKTKAVDEVNSKSAKLVSDIKNFGIPDKDIQTQSVNIYREPEFYYENGVQKNREGDWSANITVETTIRDTTKVEDFTALLTQNDISNIYGPSFSYDDENMDKSALLKAAYDNAKTKADSLAAGMGMKLGKTLSVVEGSSYGVAPYLEKAGMGAGGAGIEPGSSSVSETLTVTFELK
jgi:hypothetical protein